MLDPGESGVDAQLVNQQSQLQAETDFSDGCGTAPQEDAREGGIDYDETLQVNPRKQGAVGTYEDVDTGKRNLDGAVWIGSHVEVPDGEPQADV